MEKEKRSRFIFARQRERIFRIWKSCFVRWGKYTIRFDRIFSVPVP